jgi:type II secretory ATPase GspE/PulE/Tfp pilus assembly ATPase PilB-like protein
LIAEKEGGGQKEGGESLKRVRTQRRCGRCRETGYNARTCAVEIVDASNSDESE